MRQKHKNSARFTSSALKSLNFAQILEFFAQTCVFMSLAFRNFVTHQKYYPKYLKKAIQTEQHWLLEKEVARIGKNCKQCF